MKVLITGGFGYVGGRLARHLASSGHEVFIGSRTFKSKPSWLVKGSVIVMDWGDDRSLLNACENIDVIVHAAGMNAKECSENPELALQVNGAATESLVRAASKQSVCRFIYISSAHVYTADLSGVISEESSITNMHPYATSQVAGEQATINGHSNIAMQTVVVRLSNAIGAPLTKDVNCWMLVVNDLCKQAALERKMEIHGIPDTMRNFVTLGDTCSGIEHIINYKGVFESSLICNLGGRTYTLMEMASEIRNIYLEDKDITVPIIISSQASLMGGDYFDFQSLVLQKLGYCLSNNYRQELTTLINFCESELRT